MENSRKELVLSKLTGKLKEYELEKDALRKQVEELKAPLQIQCICQEQNLKQMMQTESLMREVEDLKHQLLQEKCSRQQEESRNLQDALRELNDLTEQFCDELIKKTETEQLYRQKTISEKETGNDLRLGDAEAMDNIATDVHDIRSWQIKDLEKDFRELKVAHQELEHVKVSYRMKLRYETERMAERENSLTKQIEKDLQSGEGHGASYDLPGGGH
ncbi:Cortactin-binding protein 2 [Dissostichus eleginoides]|uniref:Cortactin-binding protein 2 n=1 Tax=Dissostichus eleginoides TaxID=100907 RepID=A0AAD9FC14_DISEL|nr:Cortactin-binding protein 2 [Dissostichus eleginoides]